MGMREVLLICATNDKKVYSKIPIYQDSFLMPNRKALKADFLDFMTKSSRILKQNRDLHYCFLADGTPIDDLSQIPMQVTKLILGHKPPD